MTDATPALLPCTGLWGAATLIESDPAAEVVRNALYRPTHPSIFLDAWHEWGIYHPDGRLVQACAYYRLPDKALIGQSQHLPPPPDPDQAPPGTYLYGGPVIMHYGHFLTAALPRLWQAVRRGLPSGARILVHSHEAPEAWFQRDYVRAILGRLGMEPDRFVRFERPTAIPCLHVPRPALEEQNFAHRVFRDLCLRIGRPLGAPRGSRIAYLSKTRVANGTFCLMNEAAMEDVMRTAGIEVVHPEGLPWAEQVALLSSCAAVVGTAGSAFHTAIFCEQPPAVLGLAYGPVLNSNYALLDGLAGVRAQYFHSPSVTPAPSDAATFPHKAADPAALAQALLQHLPSGAA